jgi:hypothetical protein
MFPTHFAGEIGKDENDVFEVINTPGHPTIGFHLIPPTGGTVTFEATFNGLSAWKPITMRGVDSDLLSQTADAEDSFIGSISGVNRFRIRTSSVGSAPGSVSGSVHEYPCVIETVEFGPPPHKVGYAPIHKDANYTTAQTATALWTPASGKKFVVTDIGLFASGSTDAIVTIYDETNATGNRIFSCYVEVATNKQFKHSHAFKVPWVSSAVDNVLRVTTSDAINIYVGAHGYEI